MKALSFHPQGCLGFQMTGAGSALSHRKPREVPTGTPSLGLEQESLEADL